MDRFVTGAILVGAAVLFVLLVQHLRRASVQRITQRTRYLDACRALLDAPRMGRGNSGFARLGGHHQGVEADIQVLPDTLTFRKLPALWVLVTLPGTLPVSATINLMIRPTGIEPFSRFQSLTHQLERPDDFPDDCAIRTDSRAHMPPEELVFLAEEAQRSRYLIYRDAEMGVTPLASHLLKPKLDQLIALRADVLNVETAEVQGLRV